MMESDQENDLAEPVEVLPQAVFSQAEFINLMAQYKRAVYEQFWPTTHNLPKLHELECITVKKITLY